MSFCDNVNKTTNKTGYLIYKDQLESYDFCTCSISGAAITTIREYLPCNNTMSCTHSMLEVNGNSYDLYDTLFSENITFYGEVNITLNFSDGTGSARLWVSFEGKLFSLPSLLY